MDVCTNQDLCTFLKDKTSLSQHICIFLPFLPAQKNFNNSYTHAKSSIPSLEASYLIPPFPLLSSIKSESINLFYCYPARIATTKEVVAVTPVKCSSITIFSHIFLCLLASAANRINEDPSPWTTKLGISCGGISLLWPPWS